VIKNGKDFWAGAMFLAFGIGFMLVARNYSMGSSVRMGPAYFPTMLGGFLAVLGAIIFLRSFFSKNVNPLKVFTFRPINFVIGVVLAIAAYYMKGTSGGFVYEVLRAASLIVLTSSVGPRSLYVILSAVIVFAFLLKPLGLAISTAVMIFLAAYGGNEFKAKEVAIVAAILIIFTVVVFVWGLGLPFNICPAALDDQCRALGISR
jgi:hypothetical protein